MKARHFFFLACFFLFSKANGQEYREFMQLGLQGSLGFPVGQFRNSIQNSFGKTGLGGGLHVLFNTRKEGYAPVFLGVDFNYLYFGTEKTPESQFLPPLKTTFNYFTLGPLFRVVLVDKDHGFVPFVDGLVGLKILNSKTRVDNSLVTTLLVQEPNEALFGTNYEGFVTGLGLGFFYKSHRKEMEDLATAFFVKLTFEYGDKTRYVKRNSIAVDPEGQITYQTGHTPTSLINLQFGILGW
ncbi:MAG: hypothetical protein LPK25_01980 [Cyclobacteriaceae bacterium]|nr:hypothetical protein [Cyclobacteriaceae bacterium]MDX5465562.1 hypothetical protein [Cyclobacteriaceae bacterium]